MVTIKKKNIYTYLDEGWAINFFLSFLNIQAKGLLYIWDWKLLKRVYLYCLYSVLYTV